MLGNQTSPGGRYEETDTQTQCNYIGKHPSPLTRETFCAQILQLEKRKKQFLLQPSTRLKTQQLPSGTGHPLLGSPGSKELNIHMKTVGSRFLSWHVLAIQSWVGDGRSSNRHKS